LLELARLRKPLSIYKPVGAGFVENQKNWLKTSQNSIFENVELEPVSTGKLTGFPDLPADFTSLSIGFFDQLHCVTKIEKMDQTNKIALDIGGEVQCASVAV
jgi:hypothetical protein